MRDLFNKYSGSQAGVGIIEVLMASAIIGVVAVGFTGLLTTMQSGVNNTKFRSDADVLNEEMRSLLSSPDACKNSFQGLRANGPASHAITQLRDFSGAPVYAVNSTQGDRSVTIRSLTLKDFVAGPNAVTAQMTLHGDFLTAKESAGSQVVLRTIRVGLTLNGSGDIVNCVALARMSDGIWQRTPANLNNIFFASPVLAPPGGRVGIGNTNPESLLDVVGFGTGSVLPDYPVIRVLNTNTGNNSYAAVQVVAGGMPMAPTAVEGKIVVGNVGTDPNVAIAAVTPHPITFAIGDAGRVPHEHMRITPGGAVGIGLTQPVSWNALPSVGVGVLHIHSETQGMLVISGVGDRALTGEWETHSSVNLAGEGASVADPKVNAWVLAHKKRTGHPLEDGFVISKWTNNNMRTPFTILKEGQVIIHRHTVDLQPALRVEGEGAGADHRMEVGIASNASALVRYNAGTAYFSNTSGGETVLGGTAGLRLSNNGNGSMEGQLTADSFLARSDERLKSDFSALDGYALARKLRGLRFVWSKSGEPDIGFLAQEVERVAPELVVTSPEGMKSLKYGNITAILVEAFHTLDAENRDLRRQLDQLSQRVLALEKRP